MAAYTTPTFALFSLKPTQLITGQISNSHESSTISRFPPLPNTTHRHNLRPNSNEFSTISHFPSLPSSTLLHYLRRRCLKLCRTGAAASASSSSITEFDLYDMLGVDNSCDQEEIKTAYRSLQKRCHPDIAGPAGHDMAIILNEAYALLSDPLSRSAYDKEQAKTAELRGYTGRPLYSVWLGTETEQRAVFVDEVRCVGCLKCALFANNTFAVESVYGRARVVAQWADPEHKIQESIDSCPVNCISIVDRSELAPLEFLMSKQPRGNVRIGFSNTGGKRVFDVFSEVKVFNKRLEEALHRKSHIDSKYSTLQSDARLSAIRAIKSISNWLYWKPPVSESSSNLTLKGAKRRREADVSKLRDAAAAARINATLKNRKNTRLLPQTRSKDEYWIPASPVCPPESKIESSVHPTVPLKPSSEAEENPCDKSNFEKKIKQRNPLILGIPMGLAVIAASVARLHEAEKTVGGLEEHIGGSLALQVVNSSWLQVVLAGVTWYLIGVAVLQLAENFASRGES